MKKTIVLLSLFTITATSQTPALQWAKKMGGASSDMAYHVATDPSNNVYVAGTFENSADLDPGAATASFQSAGGNDVFIVKLDPSGNLLWAKTMGGTSDERPNALAVSATGEVYVAGIFNSHDADFDPSSSTFTMDAGFARDGFIVKLDASGNFAWAGQMGGYPAQQSIQDPLVIEDIALSGGTVYLTGHFEETADLDPTTGTFVATAAPPVSVNNYPDMFVTRLTGQGVFIDAIQIGGSGGEIARNIDADAAGNMFVSGDFSYIADFDPSAATHTLDAESTIDGFALKLTPAGSLSWIRNTEGEGYYNYYGQAIDKSGNVYLLGVFFGTEDADPGPGTQTYTASSALDMTDITVTKLDASGNTLWISRIGDSNDKDIAFAIAVDNNHNVYVAAGFEGDRTDFDPSAGTHTLSADNGDLAVFSLNANGSLAWVFHVGDSGYEIANDIALDAKGDVLVSGHFSSSSIDFDPGSGNTVLSAQGSDGFVLKLGKNCSNLSAAVQLSENMLVASISNALYGWYDCSYGALITGENSMTFTPSENGSYAVIVDAGGCRDTSDCFQYVRTDIEPSSLNASIDVWPNPNSGTFNLRLYSPGTLAIYNMQGRLIRTVEWENENNLITVTDLQTGIYLLRTNSGQTKYISVLKE